MKSRTPKQGHSLSVKSLVVKVPLLQVHLGRNINKRLHLSYIWKLVVWRVQAYYASSLRINSSLYPLITFGLQFNLGDWKGGMVSHRMVVSDGKVGPGTVIKASVLVKQKEEVFYILYFRLEVKELLFFSFFLALKNWMIFFCLLLF